MANRLEQNTAEAIELLQQMNAFSTQIETASAIVAESLRLDGRMLACGNGGSSSEAGHLTTELVVRYKKDRKAYGAICLNTNGGDLTAIGNDYSFEQVFERQVEAYGRKGDCLIVFTSSGQSQNILLALRQAKAQGLKTIAFLGKDGGFCMNEADCTICVPHFETARVQEAHLLLLHTLCDLVEAELGHA
ncbi:MULTISPECIES: SIS domain-containing protein [unclassified Lentimonas]|uniref:D-sedoheptulose-7-phosphate isomerase n=1 Tax=unclassified Lentimonas TaxID=2630993 RepID=UPI00132B38A0|nr:MULTISPECIES: SIS domain-containing protein [unclassified Lentimonas]CAA6689448.1 Phosphoheptose isomerase (EC [Lentimonas sp. CC10]CAA6696424.1 Phosphoheptose isomerase (EC [Lentimonas sp. CC19]CAA7070512.1 Phosphoheptose isomerase (EC [Lentimonas sp. CC11]